MSFPNGRARASSGKIGRDLMTSYEKLISILKNAESANVPEPAFSYYLCVCVCVCVCLSVNTITQEIINILTPNFAHTFAIAQGRVD